MLSIDVIGFIKSFQTSKGVFCLANNNTIYWTNGKQLSLWCPNKKILYSCCFFWYGGQLYLKNVFGIIYELIKTQGWKQRGFYSQLQLEDQWRTGKFENYKVSFSYTSLILIDNLTNKVTYFNKMYKYIGDKLIISNQKAYILSHNQNFSQVFDLKLKQWSKSDLIYNNIENHLCQIAGYKDKMFVIEVCNGTPLLKNFDQKVNAHDNK